MSIAGDIRLAISRGATPREIERWAAVPGACGLTHLAAETGLPEGLLRVLAKRWGIAL